MSIHLYQKYVWEKIHTLYTVPSYIGVVYLFNTMLYFKLSCVHCCQLSCVYCCQLSCVYCYRCLVCIFVSCLVCIVVVVLCVLLLVVLCVLLQLSCVYCCQLSCVYCCSCLVCIVVISCVFAVLCVYCCFYFRCRTAGQKSVFGRSCDRPPGPATGHLDTGFSRFPCVYKQMLRRFPTFQVATTCFLCSPPDLNLVVTNFMFCLHVK